MVASLREGVEEVVVASVSTSVDLSAILKESELNEITLCTICRIFECEQW